MDEKSLLERWATVIGIIVGVGGLIVGVLTFISGQDDESSLSAAPTAAPAQPSVVPPGTSDPVPTPSKGDVVQAPAAEATAQASESSIQPNWTGSVRLARGESFVKPLPTPDSYGYGGSIIYNGDRNTLSFLGSAAAWTQERDPTYDECASLLATQVMSNDESRNVPYSVGVGACFAWDGSGTIVFARGATRPSNGIVQVQIIRWPGKPGA